MPVAMQCRATDHLKLCCCPVPGRCAWDGRAADGAVTHTYVAYLASASQSLASASQFFWPRPRPWPRPRTMLASLTSLAVRQAAGLHILWCF